MKLLLNKFSARLLYQTSSFGLVKLSWQVCVQKSHRICFEFFDFIDIYLTSKIYDMSAGGSQRL